MRGAITVARRELAAYFGSPLAYVFIVIFLALAGALTFHIGNWLERGRADLSVFFQWHPWLYLFGRGPPDHPVRLADRREPVHQHRRGRAEEGRRRC